jgi:hypothetical protein
VTEAPPGRDLDHRQVRAQELLSTAHWIRVQIPQEMTEDLRGVHSPAASDLSRTGSIPCSCFERFAAAAAHSSVTMRQGNQAPAKFTEESSRQQGIQRSEVGGQHAGGLHPVVSWLLQTQFIAH